MMAKVPNKRGAVSYEQQKPMVPEERRFPAAKWQKSHGMFITGQSMVDEVTLLASEMERKWGAGRLRLIVGADLRDKFDRQRYLYNQALFFGELEDVRVQSQRMANAWKALDRAASDAGQTIQLPEVWDHVSEEGNVYAFVRTRDDAKMYERSGRSVSLYTVEEICRILDAQSLVQGVKEAFPSAEVVGYQKRSVGDVLDDIWDTSKGLDDPLDDDIPF